MPAVVSILYLAAIFLASEGWPRIYIEIATPDGSPVGVACALIPNVPGCHVILAPAFLADDSNQDLVKERAGLPVKHTANVVLRLDVLFSCMRSNGMGPESWETLETVA